MAKTVAPELSISQARRPLRETLPLLAFRKIIKKTSGMVFWMMFLAGVLSVFFFAILRFISDGNPRITAVVAANQDYILGFWVMVVVGIVLWAPLYEYLYVTMYYYDMDDKNVVIRKGVVAKREIILPFTRITDVYVDQDVVDVGLGLYDVHISTPTSESGKFAHIDGLGKRSAAKLRTMILERINKPE